MQAIHAISALGSMLGNYKKINKNSQKKNYENKNILMKTRKGNNGWNSKTYY